MLNLHRCIRQENQGHQRNEFLLLLESSSRVNVYFIPSIITTDISFPAVDYSRAVVQLMP